MGTLSITLPTIGDPNSTEDVDIRNALSSIQTLVNGNLDAANMGPAQAWQTASLVSPVTGTIAYYKDHLGIVHVRADAWTCVASTSGTIYTFPVGYRPGSALTIVSGINAGTLNYSTISAVGVWFVTIGGTSGAFDPINGIHFKAEG